jgi:hypothetical protein
MSSRGKTHGAGDAMRTIQQLAYIGAWGDRWKSSRGLCPPEVAFGLVPGHVYYGRVDVCPSRLWRHLLYMLTD